MSAIGTEGVRYGGLMGELRCLEDRDGRDVAYIPVSTGSYVDVGMFAIILLPPYYQLTLAVP